MFDLINEKSVSSSKAPIKGPPEVKASGKFCVGVRSRSDFPVGFSATSALRLRRLLAALPLFCLVFSVVWFPLLLFC